MAVIRERLTKAGKKSYHVQVRIKGHPPQTKSFDSKTVAKQWAAHVENEIRNRRWMPRLEGDKHTVKEALDRYKREFLERRARRSKTDERQIDWWIGELGAYNLSELTSELVGRGRVKLEMPSPKTGRARAPATVVRYLAVLSSALQVAVSEWQWMTESPMLRVRKPHVDNARTRFLSQDELQKLISTTRRSENPYLYAITLLALSTGMRRGEIIGLRRRDIFIENDADVGLIMLPRTKNGEPRGVPLVGDALLEIKRLLSAADNDGVSRDALLFPSSRKPSQPVQFRKAWETAVAAASLEGPFRFHDCRHTAGAYLAMTGATARDIAELLGHKDLAMVKRYSHLSKDHLHSVARRMNTGLNLLSSIG